MEAIDSALAVIVDYAWGTPLLVLLVGGGFLLTLYSRFIPFRGAAHAIDILRGKYDKKDDPGQISHFQALSTALSATIGMGNIGGVAIGGLSIGGVAIGLAAAGGVAIGIAALGGVAIGVYSIGSLAFGSKIAIGGNSLPR